jgi:hypothetical protein
VTPTKKGEIKLDNNTNITEIDAALLSAILSLIEILVSTGATKEEHIANLFAGQREGFLGKQMFAAAGIMEHLRAWTLNSQVGRQEILELLQIPPKGSA